MLPRAMAMVPVRRLRWLALRCVRAHTHNHGIAAPPPPPARRQWQHDCGGNRLSYNCGSDSRSGWRRTPQDSCVGGAGLPHTLRRQRRRLGLPRPRPQQHNTNCGFGHG